MVNSTNQYLIDHIFYLNSGDVCIAEYQTQGRGRRGKKWISFFGDNLYLSIYWCMYREKKLISGLSLMIAIVLAELLQKLGVYEVRVKWPNDLYLKNRKLAGILVENINRINNSFSHVIIGIGVNLSSFNIINALISSRWINLQESGIVIARDVLIFKLISILRKALQKFDNDGFESFFVRWFILDNFYNKFVKLSIGNTIIKGISRGINWQGEILLERSGKIRSYFDGNIII